MRRKSFLTFAALIILLLSGANLASALEPIPVESGFSGFIRPGAGYMRYKSNMVASFLGFDLSEKKTNSLTDTPSSESTGIVLVPFSLQYTFAAAASLLYLEP